MLKMHKILYQKVKNQHGFTLVEMLVATSIFLVVLLLTISNIRDGNKNSELRYKAMQVVSEIRGAQNNAISAVPLSIPPNSVPGVYGIHFEANNSEYVLFYEATGSSNYLYDSGEDIRTFSLGQDYMITGMNTPEDPLNSCSVVRQNTMDITFTVPSGEMRFNGIQPDGTCGTYSSYNPARINLEQNSTQHRVNIQANWISGQVDHTDINY